MILWNYCTKSKFRMRFLINYYLPTLTSPAIFLSRNFIIITPNKYRPRNCRTADKNRNLIFHNDNVVIRKRWFHSDIYNLNITKAAITCVSYSSLSHNYTIVNKLQSTKVCIHSNSSKTVIMQQKTN